MRKEKVKKYFQNFFLMSVLFHLILLAMLSMQKVQKTIFVKENLINISPFKYFDIPQTEIESQQTEAIINPAIEPEIDIVKVSNQAEQVEIIEKMPIYARDIQGERFEKMLDIKRIEKDFINEALNKINNTGINKHYAIDTNIEGNGGIPFLWDNKSGVDPGRENISEEFKRKKISGRIRYEGPNPNGLVNASILEKSDRATITTVKVWVDADGKVTKAEIYKSSGYIELDQVALDSIRKRYFIPSKADPVRIAIIEIDFTHIR